MKRTRISLLVAVVLLTAMVLSSCGASYGQIFNEDYVRSDEMAENGKFILGLEDYEIVNSYGDFVWFKDEGVGGTSHKIFSYPAKAIILTVNETDKEKYNFEFVNDTSSVRVTKRDVDDGDYTYYLYDAVGVNISTSNENWGAPVAFADYVIYGGVIYTVEDSGALKEKNDLPEYALFDSVTSYNDEYLYVKEGSSTIVVYDSNFNYVSSWSAPVANYSYSIFEVLNNGDIFVQSLVRADYFAEEDYDIIDESNTKYDLATYIIDVESGKAKELNFKYRVSKVSSAYELLEDEDRENYFTEDFENIAYITPIVDKRIDASYHSKDIVMLSNKGKIGKSLKLVDGQAAELPVNLGSGKYLVETVYGRVIANGEGEVLKVINNDDIQLVGNYFVGDNGIYDLELNKVYNFREHNAKLEATIDGVVFVKAGEDDNYSILAFRGAEPEVVCTYNESSDKLITFKNYAVCYSVADESTGKYEYYNASGKLLTTVYDSDLSWRCSSYDNDVHIFECEGEYYVFY